MIVVLRVPLAFLRTRTTRLRARHGHLPRQVGFERRLSRQHAASRLADVGAVEVKPDAADELPNGFLTRQASAQLMQVVAQRKHSSMQRVSTSRSTRNVCGWAWIIS